MNRMIYCLYKDRICPIVDSLAIPIPTQSHQKLVGSAPSISIMHLLCIAHKEQENDPEESIKLHWVEPSQVEILGDLILGRLELRME